MEWIDVLFIVVVAATIFATTMACRMSYEKFCTRIGRPYKSWRWRKEK